MENPKLCIDCKHHQEYEVATPFKLSDKTHACQRKSKINIVDGYKYPPYKDCFSERENALRLEKERCGYQGIYWESK